MDTRDKPLPLFGQKVETQPKPDASPRQAETKPRLKSAGPETPTNKPEVATSKRQFGGEPPDELVPDPQVWREFDISSMTGWRWSSNSELGFPPPIKIRNRNYRSRRQLEEFKRRMLRRAIAEREEAAA